MPHADVRGRLLQLLNGYQFTKLIHVAAELRIADYLKSGPMHIDNLAQACEAHASSLYRILRALAGVGVFIERPGRYFDLTPLAVCLQEDAPDSLRELALMRSDDYYRTWGELLFSVRTGEPSFKHVFGMSNWEYRERNPKANTRFNSFVAQMARRRADLLNRYSFPEEGIAIDVGGGNGTLLISILNRYPHLTGIVFDMPQVTQEAQHQIERSSVADRCAAVGGDVFKEVPLGGSFYILSAVLHDWDDSCATIILRNCLKAMEDSALYIIERILPAANEPSAALFSDIDMLVNTGGCERDESAWRCLLGEAGFRLDSITAIGSEFHVLRAIPTG